MGCSCSRLKGHQIHASGAQQEQAAALQAAEAVLQNNAQSSFADVYDTNRAVGHGAFAKVVECRHKVSGLLLLLICCSMSAAAWKTA